MAKVNPIQMQKYLKGVDYPASKAEIVQAAERNGAESDVKEILGKLPNREFHKPTDVSEALGDLSD